MYMEKVMLKSKFVGCLVGSAVGDALGSSFEGSSGLKKRRIGVSFSGRWTDDTHMMIGVAESLIEHHGFNGKHMAQIFIKRYEQEPWRGYGYGPPRVFEWIKSGVAWNQAAKRLFGGTGSYGNGAAMRVAPVGILYHDDSERLRSVVYGQSSITHDHELGKEGAALQAYAVSLAVKADPSSELEPYSFLSELKDFTINEVYRRKLEMVEKSLSERDKLRIVRELGNGIEAYNSVPTAICSFLHSPRNFERSLLYAVSLGGDTDTIGAMTSAISGAYRGIETIPERWKIRLEKRAYIEKLAEKLWQIKRRL
jgi:poly(ADP-ribose) glycohydrolase ARH3